MTTTAPAPIRVSDNRRFLVDAHGEPFFWLADTAWHLFDSLTFDDALHYLRRRAEQGFNVIQAVAYTECRPIDQPTRVGPLMMHDGDPARPNDDYFDHIDRLFDAADRLGLTIALLPTWGCHLTPLWARSRRRIFDPQNMRQYARYVGDRFGGRHNLVWVNGGDRPIRDDADRAVWDALAHGLRETEAQRHLMTLHPPGGSSSSRWVADADWIDMHMLQSGHSRRANPNWLMIADDYDRQPVRPVLDGEPCYENHPVAFDPANGMFGEHDVRCAAYWSLLAGACGHTYGCHDVWMMCDHDWRPVPTAVGHWRTSLELPGANQMQHAKAFALSRPCDQRIPANELLVDCQTRDTDHAAVCRGPGFLMAYFAIRLHRWALDTSHLPGDRLHARWHDPRTGQTLDAEEHPNPGKLANLPYPAGGPDWALVVDAV